jgi:hypothetical protein
MGLRGDGVAADHAACAVEGNVAVEEPDADVVGLCLSKIPIYVRRWEFMGIMLFLRSLS